MHAVPIRILTLVTCAVASGFLSMAGAATVQLPALKDNTLYEDADGDLSNGSGGFLFAGKTGASGGFALRRGVIAFDLSGIPADAVVTGVSLRMHLSRASPFTSSSNISLHLALADWGEGTSNAGDPGGNGAAATAGDATWLHRFHDASRWTTPGGDFRTSSSAALTVSAANQNYTWVGGSLMGDVQAWLANPETNFGWFILGEESSDTTAQRFTSSENATFPPLLTITYEPIPEPSTAALCSVGLLALMRRSRFRSRR